LKDGRLERAARDVDAVQKQRMEMYVDQQPPTVPCLQPSRSTTHCTPTWGCNFTCSRPSAVQGAASPYEAPTGCRLRYRDG
jgi:hypothetical protein